VRAFASKASLHPQDKLENYRTTDRLTTDAYLIIDKLIF